LAAKEHEAPQDQADLGARLARFRLGLLVAFTLGFPSFISSCGLGGIRTSAPMSSRAPFNWSVAMLTADELKYAPYLKLERVRKHINDLKREVDALLAERPFKFMVRHHRKAGKRTHYVKVEKAVPPEFSLLIGDAVHNLRCALDLTLFPMACTRSPKPDRIQFPFAKDDSPKSMRMAIENGQVAFAGTEVVKTIQNLKPYPTGDGNGGLAAIQVLDNQDKHRLLIFAAERATFTIGSDNDRFLRPFIWKSNPPVGTKVIMDGPEDINLLTVRQRYATRDLPDSEQEVEPQPAFEITFDQGEALPGFSVTQVLDTNAQEAQTAVDRMVAAFLDPANVLP
jgi:hypothetical protein